MLIVQISDLHLAMRGHLVYGLVDTYELLRRCVAHLRTLDPRPDVILATGDLTDAGSSAEYTLLRELLVALPAPVFAIPGNHDERGAFVRAFGDDGYIDASLGRVRYVVDSYPLRLVALDTATPGSAHGTLDTESLAWLDCVLRREPSRATLLMMHHPPFATGIRYMDDIGLDRRDAEAFGYIIEQHPQIRKIVCGHLHRAIEASWHGVPASTAPSCAHQIELRLSVAPSGTFTLEPPGFHLHCWDGAHIVTHVANIGPYAGPFRFDTGGFVERQLSPLDTLDSRFRA